MANKCIKVNEAAAYLESSTGILLMLYLATDRRRKYDIAATLLKVILAQSFVDLTSHFQHV